MRGSKSSAQPPRHRAVAYGEREGLSTEFCWLPDHRKLPLLLPLGAGSGGGRNRSRAVWKGWDCAGESSEAMQLWCRDAQKAGKEGLWGS